MVVQATKLSNIWKKEVMHEIIYVMIWFSSSRAPSRLVEKYEVLKKLGDGAYSDVYKCRDKETDKVNWIKFTLLKLLLGIQLLHEAGSN